MYIVMSNAWLVSLSLAALILAVRAGTNEAEPAGQPNIVFIISDDHDNEHLGFMGNETVHTPNLDRLEAGEVRN